MALLSTVQRVSLSAILIVSLQNKGFPTFMPMLNYGAPS